MRVILATAGMALALLLLGQLLGWWTPIGGVESLTLIGTSMGFVILGSLIVGKAGSNRVGWVFSLVGLSLLLSGVAAELADQGLVVFEALGGALWLAWFGAIGLLVLWYPTGKVAGRVWIWAQWLGLSLVGLAFALYLFAEELCTDFAEGQGCLQVGDNPIGIPGVPNPEYGWISGPLTVALGVLLTGSLASLVARFRRARGVERLQLKWFLLACSSFAAALTVSIAFELLSGRAAPQWLSVVLFVALAAMPVAATLAILRYRLYEIDRIISRTISYALVVGILAAAVGGIASVAGAQFNEPWVIAATTLGVAALINPLRKRIHTVVDRRFNRSRWIAESVAAEFAGSLRDQVDPRGVVDGWIGVVEETMQPSSVVVWVRE